MRQFIILVLIMAIVNTLGAQASYLILAGTYTENTESSGIYVTDLNTKSMEAKTLSIFPTFNPSYLTMTPNQQYVYAVNENTNPKDTGLVSAFAFDAASGTLKLINQELSIGSSPCHVAINGAGTHAIVANYGTGDVALYRTDEEDGSIEPAEQYFKFNGSGPNINQKSSHAHGGFFTPDEKFLYVTDLGGDKIYRYKFDPKAESSFIPDTAGNISLPAGSGPRHLVFHPYSRYMYVLNELAAKIIVFHFEKNKYVPIQTIATTEKPALDSNKGAAAIKMDLEGNFLYASTRGNANSIRIFKVDRKTGMLQIIGDQEVKKGPRDFAISPDNKFLFVASQKENVIQIFKITEKGTLEKTDKEIEVPCPVSLIVTYKR